MALVLADRVKETTATAGTGTVTLLGASTGFQSFAVIGNSNTTFYCIAAQSGSEWEVGIGTYTSSGTTLARTTVLSNSSGTQPSALSFSAGTKDVFVTYPSSRSIYADGTTLTATNSSVLPVASGGTGIATTTAYSVVFTGTTATGAFQASAGPGTSGQVLTSNGAGALPTFTTASAVASIILENAQTISSNYTITAGNNGLSAGPVTVNTGVTVTVGTGQTWVVI